MRIVVVSAHFPPNFVSGGTLQPQRLAQGLRGRGHDVSVYAGWLGDAREPGSAWTEVCDDGLPVRWIATTPWTAWDDTHNFDNDVVTADFTRHIAEVDPDVVHFHSIQTLGAGLVEAAAGRRARVVITMHDFWWFCARQFLVDRDFQPCSLVVDAGVCPCQVDRGWLAQRNRRLLPVARHADLVLAPSTSAAAVLAANGVAPDRLVVDENGLDPHAAAGSPTRHRHKSGDPVRLVYAGGSDRMKGVQVLVSAVRRLAADRRAERRDWRLAAYGIDDFLRDSNTSIEGLPVDVLPPFAPAELDRVLSEADVLVLPSVMRETHSLITREALMRGVPVVCTDSLGPEEVVEHGRNGLIVPAGDATALAHALAAVVDDESLLARLQANSDASVRDLDDQVAGLEKIYEDLLAPKAPQVAPVAAVTSHRADAAPPIERVLFVCGIEGAPLRYRARLPAEGLALQGVASDVRHYRDPMLGELAARADAVVFYRVPATVQILELIEAVRSRRTPLFFDVDDLIFDPDIESEIPALKILPPDEAALWMEGVRRYRTTMEACDVFIGSTDALCRAAEKVVGMPAERFDNGVGIGLGRLSDAALRQPRRPGPVRIGYFSGTDTHTYDWLHVEPALVQAMQKHPDVELWLGGHLPDSEPLAPFADRVHRLPLLPWTQLPQMLRDIDVNLAPLEPGSVFNEAKSAIKWLEAALTATPTVASPTQPFREAIVDGQNGVLVDSVDDWVNAVEWLVSDRDARERLGHRARRDALLRWSPHLQGRRYLEILSRARSFAGTRTSRSSTFDPVALDEPAVPGQPPLEPYEAVVAAHLAGLPPPRPPAVPGPNVGDAARRAWHAWRRDGTVEFSRKVARRVRDRARAKLRGRAGA